MNHVAVPASTARPPAASNPTARRSPGTAPGISSSSAPRRRSHRRSRSDGSAEISAALLRSPVTKEIDHTSSGTTTGGVQLPSAAELPAGAEAATEVSQRMRPRKLPKPKAPWRKVLYEQQPYEDNHVDQAFLSMLITNQNVVILEFWEVVKGTYAVSLQMNVVVLFNLLFWYTLDSCEPKESLLINCTPPVDGAMECENAVDCVFTPGEAGSCNPRSAIRDSAIPSSEVECLALDPPGDWSPPTHGTCALTDSVGCLSSLDRHSEGMSPEENCVEIAKCIYVPPSIIAEWVLALDLLLLVAGCVLMSVAYDGNGPFRGLAPQGNMTYMQRQRQRAAALASGGDKPLMGGSASMIGKALRSGLLTVGALHAFSPLLRSLTYSFSNDTVFALTVSCFTLHLVLFDYSWPTTPEPSAAAAAAEKTAMAVAEVEAAAVGPAAAAALHARQQLQQQQTLEASTVKVQVPGGGKQGQGKQVGGLYGVLSLNMAVFGSVLLSSLLESDRAVFALLALAIELFALFPLWCRHITAFHPSLHYEGALGSFCIVTLALMCTSNSLTITYILVILSFTFLVPYALCSMQRFKNTINGPWDEARVRELPSEQ